MGTSTKAITGPGAAAKTFDQTMAGLKDGVASATTGAEPQQAAAETTVVAKQAFAFGQENVAAMMQAGQILADGLQDIAKHLAASARAGLDESVSVFQRMAGVTSFQQAIELQTGFLRASYERATGDAGRLAETSIRLGEQVAAPLNARMTAAAGAFLPRR